MSARRDHPMFGPNPFKLGVFNANCDGGLTISRAPERWPARWDDIVELAKLCDRTGIEFILPVAKWRGFGGAANNLGRSFETLTHGAALAAVTERIAIFSTIHVPLVTPAFAAKALATIDHVSHGRAGLNIVCGWNQDEFDQHGVTIDPERRYDQGLEWFRIFARMLEGGAPFDWDGEFYKLKGLVTDPLSVQRPWPVVMSAGFSPKGRGFAAQSADVLFTTMTEIDQGKGLVDNVRAHAAKYDRRIDLYTMSHAVCRPSRKEAEDFYYYFAEEMADRDSLDYYKRQKGLTSTSDPRYIDRPLMTRFSRATGKSYSGSYPGAYPLVGTPDDLVEEFQRMHGLGLAGTSISFLDYLKEMPFFVAEVMPRMVKAGLRVG
ncbi:MAG: LLM class flavin-dependent oxidoreductase [Alphaproteobacteria bacterium]|nr:LLM class flavin-dependent oxidoreductase [Alphaproteobacteria bacterium]